MSTVGVPANPSQTESLVSPHPAAEIELPIAGMTCASCVNRIERFLRRSEGVEAASVNLATETATIRYLPAIIGRSDLARTIEAAGYDLKPEPTPEEAASPRTLRAAGEAEADRRAASARRLLVEAVVSVGVAIPLMIAMFSPQTIIPMERLNTHRADPRDVCPVLGWAAVLPAAWRAARHGGATMDTLIAIGTTAAWATASS